MFTERRLIEGDRFRPCLERANRLRLIRRRGAPLAWAVAAILGQACATRVTPSDALPRDVAAEVGITISNEMSRAMRIYLHAGSVDLRLGTVPAMATRTFFVPGGFANGASELQIEARERGAQVGFLTERFTLGPRRVAAWTLSRASRTSVTVR